MKRHFHDGLMVLLTVPSFAFFAFICARALNQSFLINSALNPVFCLPWLVLFSSLCAHFYYQKTSKSAWMEACKTVDLIAGGISALACLFYLVVFLICLPALVDSVIFHDH